MAVHYDFYENPLPNGSDRKKRLHARVVPTGTMTTGHIFKSIQTSSSLTLGDLKGALVAMTEKMKEGLEGGWQIHLEGLGYFQLILTCPPVRTPNSIRAESVKVKTISFRPEKQLKEYFNTCTIQRVSEKRHSKKYSEAEMDELLAQYFEKNAYMTVSRFRALCGFTETTATRRLKQLLTVGKLEKVHLYGRPLYKPAKK
jgi:predicted histone-like DNA-binding protein